MTVNVLGTTYEIVKLKYNEHKMFADSGAGAFIEFYEKRITCCDMSTYEGWDKESKKTVEEYEKQNLRHEIVHAFLFESGLHDNSERANAWARNEEMVDWFAINGAKIYKAWQEVGCI
ncbi:MAG: hypothetical protein LUD19_01205 [Clostridia bacterium]|nr:hypothetical protein [Clostridia bacterium]